MFPFDGVRGKSGKDEYRTSTGRRVMNCSTQCLCAYINMNDYALRLPSESGISICHRQRDHLGAGGQSLLREAR